MILKLKSCLLKRREKLEKSKEAWKHYIPEVSKIVYDAVNEVIEIMALNHVSTDRIAIDLGSNEQAKFTALSRVLEAYRKEGYRITVIDDNIKDINCNTNGIKTLLVTIPPLKINDMESDAPPNIIPEPTFINKSRKLKED